MAAYITHKLAAKAVFSALGEDLKEKITAPLRYYAGAQGGDCFFIYRPLRKKGFNLGKLLHRRNVYAFFSAAREYAENTGDYSYILGYITHYAVDTVFHPYVYATEYETLASLEKPRKKDKVHFLIERDADAFLLRRYGGKDDTGPQAPPSEEDGDAIFALLDYAVKKSCGFGLEKKAVKSALARFPRQQSYLFDTEGTRRKRIYGIEKKLRLRHFFSYMFLRENPDARFETLKNGGEEKSVYRLFEEAVEKSVMLIGLFVRTPAGEALDETLFSSDFNSGKRERRKR